jgi:hypothetical protein
VDCGLWIADCGLRIADCGLWIADCGASARPCLGAQLGREQDARHELQRVAHLVHERVAEHVHGVVGDAPLQIPPLDQHDVKHRGRHPQHRGGPHDVREPPAGHPRVEPHQADPGRQRRPGKYISK